MKKLYNFRLDPDLVHDIDKLPGSRTSIVTSALQLCLQTDTRNVYDVNLVDLLKSQIDDLKDDKHYLQNQISALMVSRSPTLKEWFIYRIRGSNR